MAITVEEKYGRRLAGNTHERTYIVRGTLDDEVAFTALLEQTPTERGELLRKDDEIELEEIEGVVSGDGGTRRSSSTRWAAGTGRRTSRRRATRATPSRPCRL